MVTKAKTAHKRTRTASKRPARPASASSKRPARRTAKTSKRNPRPARAATRRQRPERRTEAPLEFVELPLSGTSGSSWEPDSYTPKADLAPRNKPRRFLGLFGR
ncbi:MAG: hypothetical protein QOI63_1950 [Thermoplasmata archaeon]|jgi:hypothetical protein|nr:hypothetical protein [Thermoplasmata archaeon]